MASVTSMTGYARAEGRCDLPGLTPFSWIWEAKSVNGKGLDVRVRVPAGFDSLELPVRQAAATGIARGSLTLGLHITSDTAAAAPKINEALLDAVIALSIKKATGLPTGALGKTIAPARLDGLMALRGVLEATDFTPPDADVLAARDQLLLKGAAQALERLSASRRQEGARLAPVVSGVMAEIAQLADQARGLAATQPATLQARLQQQVSDLANAVPALTPERLAQEVALLALKADVREELDRLGAHIGQARELLEAGAPCGRRLDFLSQEFNREANTLCSKSTDVALTKVGLALKTAIDQFREQIQNIE
jgi:uncharacterized protein (TIGR00255 family)